MNKPYYIGLMSGTSLDSIDAVLVSFAPQFRLHATHTHPLPEDVRDQILQLTRSGPDEIDRLGVLDIRLGNLFGKAALALLDSTRTEPSQVEAIGSHGQTIRHRPEQRFSLQIGDPATIAEQTGITTIADFRRRDLAAGGQGAPLVPAFHEALFRSPTQDRVLINLGGMANITLLPADIRQPVTGYDTGPGNVLMDAWIQQRLGQHYDAEGHWASSGRVNDSLLAQLLSHSYFRQPPPKSTGRELFDLPWLEQALTTLIHAPEPADIQATLLELTARSLADAIQCHELCQPELYLCGGGSHNKALHLRLQQLMPDARIDNTATLGLPPDWVEAAAFAWFAMRTRHQQTSSLASVTGACQDRILGAVHLA